MEQKTGNVGGREKKTLKGSEVALERNGVMQGGTRQAKGLKLYYCTRGLSSRVWGLCLAEEALSHATAPRYSPFLAQVTVQHKSSVLPVNMVSKVIV